MGKGFEAGGAVLGLVHLTGAETMQQCAHNAPHVRVVVDDQKAQAIEIDSDHAASRAAGAETPILGRLRVNIRR